MEAEGFADADRLAKETVILRNKLESLLRNTQKSFAKFNSVLSTNDQEIAERIFKEAETAIKLDGKEAINKALNSLERVAGQLTAAMMDPTGHSSATSLDNI
jgi:molecular chaperone DnaK (HSP70)